MSKKNRAALRRSLLTLSLVLVVAFAAVGGTLAWLTDDAEPVTNTFVLGEVIIDLDETDYDVYGEVEESTDPVKANEYKLLPGQTYLKDPTVHVDAESEPCYLFVKIVNELADIEVAEGEGKTIAEQMETNGWVLLDADEGIYYYNGIVQPGVDVPVFGSFTLDGEISNEDIEQNDGDTIVITAYAVQSDNIADPTTAWNAEKATFGFND